MCKPVWTGWQPRSPHTSGSCTGTSGSTSWGPELCGGLSGEAGDVWFEVEHPYKAEPPPWEVTARLVVFCDRRQCTRDLIRVERAADTPAEAVGALQEVITEMGQRVQQAEPFRILQSTHDDLPAD